MLASGNYYLRFERLFGPTLSMSGWGGKWFRGLRGSFLLRGRRFDSCCRHFFFRQNQTFSIIWCLQTQKTSEGEKLFPCFASWCINKNGLVAEMCYSSKPLFLPQAFLIPSQFFCPSFIVLVPLAVMPHYRRAPISPLRPCFFSSTSEFEWKDCCCASHAKKRLNGDRLDG